MSRGVVVLPFELTSCKNMIHRKVAGTVSHSMYKIYWYGRFEMRFGGSTERQLLQSFHSPGACFLESRFFGRPPVFFQTKASERVFFVENRNFWERVMRCKRLNLSISQGQKCKWKMETRRRNRRSFRKNEKRSTSFYLSLVQLLFWLQLISLLPLLTDQRQHLIFRENWSRAVEKQQDGSNNTYTHVYINE